MNTLHSAWNPVALVLTRYVIMHTPVLYIHICFALYNDLGRHSCGRYINMHRKTI